MKKFALIGAGGYVAPLHLRAIKETGGDLLAALDPSDSVGIMDSYFPETNFFTEFERFDRHMDKLRRSGQGADYVSICSPNYLHDAHVRFALRSDADAICEKPLVLNPWNVEGLMEVEAHSDHSVSTILQLRLHPAIIDLKSQVSANPERVHDVDLTYITPRGRWYHVSWKGDEQKSGGVSTNIGVHFFDMLGDVFGKLIKSHVHLRDDARSSGYLEFEKARVRWFLSVDQDDLPQSAQDDQGTYRSITVDGDEVEFSGGFDGLHTQSYKEIMAGRGFGLEEARPSVELVSSIRQADVKPSRGERHPFVEKYI